MSAGWKWAIGVALAASILWALTAYAGAVAEANIYGSQVEKLKGTLVGVEADTVRLSAQLRLVDEENAKRTERDSLRILELEDSTVVLGKNLDSLRVAEQKHAEGLEGALSVLAERLGPEDLPYLRHVVDAQHWLFAALREQVKVKDRQIALRVEEIGIVRTDLRDEVKARRAADVLADGLRTQITVQVQIIETQGLEISSLRSAVAPSIVARVGQNLKMIGLAATATTLVLFIVR